MALIDDVREIYVRVLDAADYARLTFADEFGEGLAVGYDKTANVLQALLNKYEQNDSYLDHEPLE